MKHEDSRHIKIIAAHAGTGKSFLAKQNQDKYIDFVCMPYKYHLPKDFGKIENEACKADFSLEMRFCYPYNYFVAIKGLLEKTDKTLIIPPDRKLLRLFRGENIPYFLCYPEDTAASKTEYHRRYVTRGNTETFIDIFIGSWDAFLDNFKSDTYGFHIILKPHEFLSDVIKNPEGGVKQ